ncbi:phosphocholine-specific phospholipase C [Sphingobacterium cellulitidis]|uniref:phospholipase C n=1 Tax=Sphingobacterium cellulitidis TaxID=1768011 RepID=A0A8H9KV30_9SPHI|nr:phospholipase C, phosphocholine-specific [Sphingobacterium soli]MBA8986646.1 phospholipase C [Sphingobacterium soli]GGE27649.1 hypothetical protein GCM10011516_26610 [Sphingobacterium soli]
MDTRREFLKKASMLAGASAAVNFIPESIQRALAIDANPGTNYLDAEHIVFLMQENRSFDHCFGTLKGVRGFNDPRALRQPNGYPVWYQENKKEEIFAPFHLDIENTKITWMGSLPHGWRDMVAARNEGKMDTWLEAKRAGDPEYKHIPLTMGYFERKDIPFYYAFADAFTVCDQHFCSSLTGTSANRSYFWSGTVREEPHNPESTAHVDNYQINYKDVSWKTYPERLQEAGIPWKVYQNELSLPVGFEGEEEDWLANFTDNNLEFHKQYQVKFHPAYYEYAKRKVKEIEHLLTVAKFASQEAYQKVVDELNGYKKDVETYSPENFAKLSNQEQEIHRRAFTTNTNDPNYHSLSKIKGQDSEEIEVPQGDVFHQFREDVKSGNLPAISWLVAPCRFSDHPGSPWYGAWYVSETLDILTANPEVWKKTIFILTYDENDGYFDHISPFVPPLTNKEGTGAVPKGMDTADEYVTVDQENKRTGKDTGVHDSPIGLGYRVPLVIASPWSKGGWVNSEVFDHTSPLQFLEHFIQKKYKKPVIEKNITEWRRLVCGDLTSAFRPLPDIQRPAIDFVNRDQFVERIYSARDKSIPENFKAITKDSLKSIKNNLSLNTGLGLQEKGTKSACAIPYDIDVNLSVSSGKLNFHFSILGKLSQTKVVGVPFQLISHTAFGSKNEIGRTWNFAVKPKESLTYSLDLSELKDESFCFSVHGPNGFYRAFKAKVNAEFPLVEVNCSNAKKGFQITISKSKVGLKVQDPSYGHTSKEFAANRKVKQAWNLEKSQGWYDFEITSDQNPDLFIKYAGHIENGKPSSTDPLMGEGNIPS